jgi:hypothetical protein
VDETQTGGCEKIMDIGTSCKSWNGWLISVQIFFEI